MRAPPLRRGGRWAALEGVLPPLSHLRVWGRRVSVSKDNVEVMCIVCNTGLRKLSLRLSQCFCDLLQLLIIILQINFHTTGYLMVSRLCILHREQLHVSDFAEGVITGSTDPQVYQNSGKGGLIHCLEGFAHGHSQSTGHIFGPLPN